MQSSLSLIDLSAIAFTRGPGLLGSLLVGTSFAKTLSVSLGIPVVDVNHLQGHILACFIRQEGVPVCEPRFPYLCLLVSGGNSQIVKVNSYKDMEIIGQTIDDAAGEAIDKKAEWLQMGWFLYYQRNKWTKDVTKAMLTALPQGKMTMLDYFCERMEVWRMHDKFYGQPYIWCYLGNFGGNSVLQGNVKKSGELLETALKDGGANLKGIGSTLEGFDVQQFPFEYIFDKAWNYGATDADVVKLVADSHADQPDENVRKAWDVLYNKVLTSHATTWRGTGANGFPNFKKQTKRCRPYSDMKALNEAWQLLLKQQVFQDPFPPVAPRGHHQCCSPHAICLWPVQRKR